MPEQWTPSATQYLTTIINQSRKIIKWRPKYVSTHTEKLICMVTENQTKTSTFTNDFRAGWTILSKERLSVLFKGQAYVFRHIDIDPLAAFGRFWISSSNKSSTVLQFRNNKTTGHYRPKLWAPMENLSLLPNHLKNAVEPVPHRQHCLPRSYNAGVVLIA
jgi:hypothetical protein